MQRTNNEQVQDASEPTAPKPNLNSGFYGFQTLCAEVPLSPRTLRQLIKDEIIPHIRVKGGRRLLFHGPSVSRSLLRFQKGGIPE